MDSEKLLRKRRRALLTKLRESCIFSMPLTLVHGSSRLQVVPHRITETNPRDLSLQREIGLSVESRDLTISKHSELSLLVHLDEEVFQIPLENFTKAEGATCIATLTLEAAQAANRRRKERKREPISYFTPVLLYTKSKDKYPIPGYARIQDSDEQALCLNLQFFLYLEETSFEGAELLFLEKPLGIYERSQRIRYVRNYRRHQQVDSYVTKTDVVLEASIPDIVGLRNKATVQPTNPLTIELDCILHERRQLRANITELLSDGFSIDLHEHERDALPSQFQVDHETTGLRFNASKEEGKLFISYQGLSLGSKTIWFNFITKHALGYDHCFTAKDAKKIIHLMFESGNYTSEAILQLSLMDDFFQCKWPIEEAFSPTKYRWLVRDRSNNYIGHTMGVRVSNSLWSAIDNIGSQHYEGSWNAEFVARWIRSFAELLADPNHKNWIQWTFVPEAGVWTRFDEMIKSDERLTATRDRFWGVFFLNRKRTLKVSRDIFSVVETSSREVDASILPRLTKSQQTLLGLLSDGIDANSPFQMDFEKEYGFRLTRFYKIIESKEHGKFLLTYSNYPSWATLHKGHNWDYLFPLDATEKIDSSIEGELLDCIEEAIFRSGCNPYRLAIVSPTIRLSSGVEWTNLSLHPDALEWAARSLEKL